MNLINRIIEKIQLTDFKVLPKKTVKIQFINFWNGFQPSSILKFLLPYYNFEISSNPDYVIFSCFVGKEKQLILETPTINTDAVKIFYTGENIRPDMSKCDYALSFCYEDDITDPHHFRVPYYFIRLMRYEISVYNLINSNYRIKNQLKHWHKKGFCSYLVSSSHPYRDDFFQELCKYKKVDSGGRHLNNMGGQIVSPKSNFRGTREAHFEKMKFFQNYKFALVFENSEGRGYTTEKIVDAFLAGVIPIYRGNPLVYRDFNPKSFINFHDYSTPEEVIKHIQEIDQDYSLYKAYLEQPCLYNNQLSKYLKLEYYLNIFQTIFA